MIYQLRIDKAPAERFTITAKIRSRGRRRVTGVADRLRVRPNLHKEAHRFSVCQKALSANYTSNGSSRIQGRGVDDTTKARRLTYPEEYVCLNKVCQKSWALATPNPADEYLTTAELPRG